MRGVCTCSDEGLLARDFATYKDFYGKFDHPTEGRKLIAAESIDATSDICYTLKKGNNSFFNQQITSQGGMNLSNTILIVDEVDDLVVNENPLLRYNKPDEDTSAIFEACYDALRSSTGKPSHVEWKDWRLAESIKKVADGKVPEQDYRKQDGEIVMLEKLPDGTYRTPKVPLDDDWRHYLNFTECGRTPKKLSFFNALCTPYVYSQYNCIFGLTGSVGSISERKYMKESLRAVAYEVPQFLNTCAGPQPLQASEPANL